MEENRLEFRTYKDRIALVDDREQALAEIDFPAMEGEPRTVEITHTYVDESLRGRGLAGKLMQRLAAYLRKNQLKAYPSCSYAIEWFGKHTEEADLLSTSYLYGDEEDTAAEAEETEDAEEDPYFQNTEYGTETADGPVDNGIGDHILTGINRVLQLFSAASLILLYILMIVPALQNPEALGSLGSMITERNMAEISYISSFLLLTLFSFLSFFWILSRKKIVRSGKMIDVDSGRGITAFTLLLLTELAALFLSLLVPPEEPVFLGISTAAEALRVNYVMILEAAVCGLVLSVIRRMIRH